MNGKILLTGRPGTGKTTLIKRVVEKLTLPAGGFYTEEIRERSERIGFKIVALNNEEAVLAHVKFRTAQRVGKYGVDLCALELAVEAVRTATNARRLVVIDEIGPMEIKSPRFCDAVKEALDSSAPILGTITARSFPFTNKIKRRSDVKIIEVRRENRERLASELPKQFA
jgi:nucleoside-triphosphatase